MSTDDTTTAAPRQRRAISWGLLDQVVASGATFLFIVFAASNLSAPDLGAVAFAFELYLLSVFIVRGIAGDPLTSRFAGQSDSEIARGVRSAATTAVLVGVGLGVILAGAAWFTDPPMRDVLLVAAVALPGLALQDFVRAALIVRGRVRSTFLNDTFWAVGQLPAMWLATQLHPTAPVILGAWAATGCVAAVIGLVQLRTGLARPSAARGWLRETRDLWPYYLGDNMIYQLSSLTLILVVSATAGLAAMAGFRVAMTVYAPLSLIGRGVITVMVALLAGRRDDPAGVRRSALLISTVLTPLAIGWGLLTLLIPMSAGEAVFGESWREAEPVVFLASFVCASGLFATGAVIGLRALSAGRHTLTGRIIVSVGAGIAALVGGVAGDEHGLFLALAIFFPVQVVVWWVLLRDAARRAPTPASNSDDSDDSDGAGGGPEDQAVAST